MKAKRFFIALIVVLASFFATKFILDKFEAGEMDLSLIHI